MSRGSKPGERRGGRKKGVPNKTNAEREAAIRASGLTPLDYLLEVMRDETKPEQLRQDAAKAAAPYVHPKLSSVEVKGDPDHPMEQRVTVVDEQQVAAAVAKVESDY